MQNSSVFVTSKAVLKPPQKITPPAKPIAKINHKAALLGDFKYFSKLLNFDSFVILIPFNSPKISHYLLPNDSTGLKVLSTNSGASA